MGTRSLLRSAAALVMVTSWLAISNHCALAALSAARPAADECPMHSQPAKEKTPTTLVCCKVLRAADVSVTVKVATPQLCLLAPIEHAAMVVAPQPFFSAPSALLDTGPPGLRTFAELILQRSLLAHAPPPLA